MERDEELKTAAAASAQRRGPPPRQAPAAGDSQHQPAAGADDEVVKLRAEVAEMRALLGEAALRKVVNVPQAASVLKHKHVAEPLVEMTLMDKGRGKVSTGGLAGFERMQEFGSKFTTPESSGRLLWNKDYATPVDRAIIAKWEKENERERIGLMAEKKQLQALLDKVHYHDKVRAPDTLDHVPVV